MVQAYCLLWNHRASVTFHRGVVRGEELRRDHPLKLIFGPDCGERHYGRAALTVSFLFLRMSQPKTTGDLIDQDTIPVVRFPLRPKGVPRIPCARKTVTSRPTTGRVLL